MPKLLLAIHTSPLNRLTMEVMLVRMKLLESVAKPGMFWLNCASPERRFTKARP